MVFCLAVQRCCSAVREVDCLVLILKICVDEDFFAVGVHRLKCYDVLSFKRGTIERECHDVASICLFRNKLIRNSELFAIDHNRLVCFLIHHRTGNSICLAGNEVLVLDLIKDRYFCIRIGNMIFCLRIEGCRAAVREVDRLVLVIDILVDNDNCPCLELGINELHGLKHDHAPCSEFIGIDHEEHIFVSVFFFRSEDPFLDLISFSIDHLCFELFCFFALSRLEHDFSVDHIFITGDEVLVMESVSNRDISLCHHRTVICIRVGSFCPAVRKVYCLSIIIDILVDDHLRIIMIYPLIKDYVFALELGCIEHERKLDRAVL